MQYGYFSLFLEDTDENKVNIQKGGEELQIVIGTITVTFWCWKYKTMRLFLEELRAQLDQQMRGEK